MKGWIAAGAAVGAGALALRKGLHTVPEPFARRSAGMCRNWSMPRFRRDCQNRWPATSRSCAASRSRC